MTNPLKISILVSILSMSAALHATDYFVNAARPDNSGDGQSLATAKKTIQAAINIVAASGDTIHVSAGTYPEAITVNKSVILLGAQANVDARKRSVPPAQESTIQATGSATSVTFSADNIIFNGFTVNGDTVTAGANDLGIEMFGANSGNQMLNNIVTNNTIAAYPAGNGTIVSFNNFLNNSQGGGNAIYTDFSLKNAVISSNSFANNPNGGVIVTAAAGSASDYNFNVTVQNNTITNCGVGVLFAFTTNGTIDNNQMTNCDEGVQLRGANTEIAITNNTITDSTLWPILCQTRRGPFEPNADSHDVTITGNIISQNAAVFQTLPSFTTTRALIDCRNIEGFLTISKNLVTLTSTLPAVAPRVPGIEIQGNTTGVVSMEFNELRGGNADPAGSTTPSAGVRLDADLLDTSTVDIKNFIIGGFAYAVETLVANDINSIHVNFNQLAAVPSSGTLFRNGGSGTLDALYNWYGSVAGPTTPTNPSGGGTAIPSGVLFNPWLASATDQAPLDQTTHTTFLASVGLQLAAGTPLGSLPPLVVSAAAAAPNPAVVNQNVQFSAAGADSLNRQITIAWNFGDGSTGTGAAVTHAYAAVGTYTATATLTTPDGGSVTTSVNVSVLATGGGAASAPQPFTVKHKTLHASTPSKARDFVKLMGAFNLPAGTTKLDGTFAISVATISRTFTVNSKGKGIGTGGTLKIRVKRKRGAIVGMAATFTLSVTGDVAGALAAAQLPAGKSGSVVLAAAFNYLSTDYAQSLTFTVKGTSSGSSGK